MGMIIHTAEDKRVLYLKYFLCLVVGFAFLTYLHDVVKEALTSPLKDFYHYFMNTKLLLQGYDIWKTDSPELIAQTNLMVSQFGVSGKAEVLHSMGFFLIFSPFTFLAPKAASLVWVMVCQISFILSIAVIVTSLEKFDIWKALCAAFLAFSFWPLREDLHLGQPNALILFLFSLSLLSLKHKKFLLAGIFLGLGIQVKEIFLPMLLFCACKKYWKSLAGALTSILFIKGAAIFAFGIDKELSYWKHQLSFFSPVLNYTSADGGIDYVSMSVIDLWHRLSDGLLQAGMSQFLIIIFFSFILWRAWKLTAENSLAPERLPLEFSCFVLLCFIFSPWIHETHFIVLVLPLLASWLAIAHRPSHKGFILFSIAYCIVGLKYSFISFPIFARGILASLLAVKAIGFLILFFLINSLLRADAR